MADWQAENNAVAVLHHGDSWIPGKFRDSKQPSSDGFNVLIPCEVSHECARASQPKQNF